MAWHLLWLYRLGHRAADQLAATYIEADSIKVLEKVSKKKISTIADFLTLLGKLGGFHPLKKQPLPGEKSLWIGLMHLTQMKIGCFAPKEKCGRG